VETDVELDETGDGDLGERSREREVVGDERSDTRQCQRHTARPRPGERLACRGEGEEERDAELGGEDALDPAVCVVSIDDDQRAHRGGRGGEKNEREAHERVARFNDNISEGTESHGQTPAAGRGCSLRADPPTVRHRLDRCQGTPSPRMG